MTPDMQTAVLDLSTFYDASPERVFQQILALLTRQYGRTMAMINVHDGERIRYRAAINLHPALAHLDSVSQEKTF